MNSKTNDSYEIGIACELGDLLNIKMEVCVYQFKTKLFVQLFFVLFSHQYGKPRRLSLQRGFIYSQRSNASSPLSRLLVLPPLRDFGITAKHRSRSFPQSHTLVFHPQSIPSFFLTFRLPIAMYHTILPLYTLSLYTYLSQCSIVLFRPMLCSALGL